VFSISSHALSESILIGKCLDDNYGLMENFPDPLWGHIIISHTQTLQIKSLEPSDYFLGG